jgi:hypothetical protein
MTEEVKKRRGNPNLMKKDTDVKITDTAGPTIKAETIPSKAADKSTNEAAVWVDLFAAIITTYSSCGSGVLAAAAQNADIALAEYKKRYK